MGSAHGCAPAALRPRAKPRRAGSRPRGRAREAGAILSRRPLPEPPAPRFPSARGGAVPGGVRQEAGAALDGELGPPAPVPRLEHLAEAAAGHRAPVVLEVVPGEDGEAAQARRRALGHGPAALGPAPRTPGALVPRLGPESRAPRPGAARPARGGPRLGRPEAARDPARQEGVSPKHPGGRLPAPSLPSLRPRFREPGRWGREAPGGRASPRWKRGSGPEVGAAWFRPSAEGRFIYVFRPLVR